MKSIVTSIAASSLLAALAIAQPPRARYTVTDLGTLPGGTFSQALFVDNNGLVSGAATLPDGTALAVLWHKGQIIAEPGLGGPNSVGYAVNESGKVAGLAESTTLDPNGEDFFGDGTHLTCLPSVWQNGVMTQLPTLGGANGDARALNNRGQVIGFAENGTSDSTCAIATPYQVNRENKWRVTRFK